MTSGNAWREERSRKRTLTDLNRATSARYAACRGRHVASGEKVVRQFPSRPLELNVCGRCGVPFGAPRAGWNGVSKA